MTVEIKPVTEEALRSVVERLRPQDEVEVRLLTGVAPLEAVMASLGRTKDAAIGYIHGSPEAIFGLTELSAEVGIPWFVGTDAVVTHAKLWLPIAVAWVDKAQEKYPVLTNVVHRKNIKAIRWLKWMGFHFTEAEVQGHPDFTQFVRYNQCAYQQHPSC